MIAPLILLLVSGAGLAATLVWPAFSDLIVLAAPCVLASAFLVLRASGGFFRHAPRHIIIDGSNVLHWNGGSPQIETVRDVVAHLKARGFTPGVVFDANAGHILTGRYQHHGGMGKLLGLPEDRVMVVDKGTPADPTILAAARDLGAKIVTNDRYKDWTETYPEARTPGQLIKGNYRDGRLWLDLPDMG